MILQQTRVVQGTSYFMTFLRYFPDAETLAKAEEREILKIWQGLGYYSRALNMQFAARQIMDSGGHFPSTYEGIRALKGVGDYTAAAIASIAFSLPYAAVDGNVKRVASRIFGFTEPIQSAAATKKITDLLNLHIKEYDPGEFNQAMMELGATICTPRNPACDRCPMSDRCYAFKHGLQATLPVVQPKKKPVAVYMNYLFLEYKGRSWIKKRDKESIWKGLYEFIAVSAGEPSEQVPAALTEMYENDKDTRLVSVNRYVHKLTHRTIFAAFWHISGKPSNIVKESRELVPVKIADIANYPVHRLMHRYLTDQGLEEERKQIPHDQ